MRRIHSKMQTYYDDQSFYNANNTITNIVNSNNYEMTPNFNNNNLVRMNMNHNNGNNSNSELKLHLTLDLNAVLPVNTNNHHEFHNQFLDVNFDAQQPNNRRLKMMNMLPVLSSPDLNMCKLPSPELEKLISQTMSHATPTPTSILFPRNVTEEQEFYARGFVEALNDLHNKNNSNNSNSHHHQQQSHLQSLALPLSQPPSSEPQSQLINSNNSNILEGAALVSSTTTPSNQNASVSSNETTYTNLDRPLLITSNSQPILQQVLTSSSSSSSSSSSAVVASSAPYAQTHLQPQPQPQSNYLLNTTNNGLINGVTGSSSSNIVIKEEPQAVPSVGSTPPVSPIDMEEQEKIKLERKRLRNRLAASKCRRRKLERISRLEDKLKILKNEHSDLIIKLNRIKEYVCHLKEQVMDHMSAGCQVISSNF